MKKFVCLVVWGFVTFGVASLSAAEQTPQTEFVFNLHRAVVKADPNANVAVSPYGVQQMLDLVRTGAVGETKTEIEQVLGYAKSVKWATPSDGTLTTAAALWTQQGHPFLSAFLRTARENFGSAIEQADFANNPDAAVKRINAWCSEKTKGKIPEILEELSSMTRLVLANAIHFAADWKVPFEENMTRYSTFTLQDGTEAEAKMMWQFGEQMKYGESSDTLILELPYKNGADRRAPLLARTFRSENRGGILPRRTARPERGSDDYAMLLLLPKEPTEFATWESEMTIEKWNKLRRTMRMEDVNMCMPRFTMESCIELNERLQQLGMTTAFEPFEADFSKISSEELFVSRVLQKTFVKVDETGTEAAAVTVMLMDAAAAPPEEEPKEFYADRPFLYAIVKGDTILFLGRFVKPEPE